MSFATVNDPHTEAATSMPPTEHPTKSSYKSHRKKYLKMRQGFKEKMRQSNSLFEEEQHATRIADRLQEQNDQLLDLLLTLNTSIRIPPPLRYALSPTPSPSAVPDLEPDNAEPPTALSAAQFAHAALEEAHQELAQGKISPTRYDELSSQLKPYVTNTVPLPSLFAHTPHTSLENTSAADTVPEKPSLSADMSVSSDTLTYLSSSHEASYLANIDAALASSDPDAAFAALKKEHQLSVKDTHKDNLLRNPTSAYNWLRKHKPDVFSGMSGGGAGLPSDLAGEERKQALKPSPKPNTSHPRANREAKGENGGTGHGRKERASAAHAKVEPEMLDDEGNLISGGLDGAGSLRGAKRKRGEDDAYRPKGGSSRPGKRKRAGTGGGGGKGGRASTGGGGGGPMEE
ncbi:MAG: hypothetical protein Q9202_000125 [Teloschistes flavicans]